MKANRQNIRKVTFMRFYIRNPVKGFSLVELLAVIAILAILAAIAIPLFLNQRAKAAQALVQSDARNVAASLNSLLKTLPPTPNPSIVWNEGDKDFIISAGGVNELVKVQLSPTITSEFKNQAGTLPAFILRDATSQNYACIITLPTSTMTYLGFSAAHRCGNVISEAGNLLTYNQATFTPSNPSQWWSSGWTFARHTAVLDELSGEKVAHLTVTGTNDPYVQAASPNVIFSTFNVDLNKPLTAQVSMKRGATQSQNVVTICLRVFSEPTGVPWENMIVNKCPKLTLTDDWQTMNVTTHLSGFTKTPIQAQLIWGINGDSPAVGNTYSVKNAGVWQGDGGLWAPPGQPIVKP